MSLFFVSFHVQIVALQVSHVCLAKMDIFLAMVHAWLICLVIQIVQFVHWELREIQEIIFVLLVHFKIVLIVLAVYVNLVLMVFILRILFVRLALALVIPAKIRDCATLVNQDSLNICLFTFTEILDAILVTQIVKHADGLKLDALHAIKDTYSN